MMRKIFAIAALALYSLAGAQKTSENIFYLEEKRDTDIVLVSRAPGAPGDPVPIDDYIPLLMIIGVVLAAYTARKRLRHAS